MYVNFFFDLGKYLFARHLRTNETESNVDVFSEY